MMPPPRRAQAIDAPSDAAAAKLLIKQAERHLSSAGIAGVDLDSRFGMLYDAARKAADAIMRVSGRRITQGFGHHIVFFDEAKRLLPAKDKRLVTRVEGARNIRNAMEYQAREVTETEVNELTDAAGQLVAAARAFVERAGTS